jgi:glycosyltransferase involved in cell wall biosynthesis
MKVSVLTPTYRHREFIGKAIESVLSQTYQDWEMIIVDDGSDDGTAEIARSYESSKITVVEQPHRGIVGLADTYNAALAKAKGELIAILEGDDWWTSDKLATQIPDFDEPSVVMSYGRYVQLQDGEETESGVPALLPSTIINQPVGSASYAMLMPNVLTFAWPLTVVVRTVALHHLGGFQFAPQMGVVDYPTLLRIGLEGEWRFHDKVLGYWRRHGRSETRSRFPEILSGARVHGSEFIKKYSERLPGDLDAIRQAWNAMQLSRTFSLAIVLADQHRFDESARALRHGMTFPVGPKTKTMLLAAIAAVKLRRNPEQIFSKFGYRGYREAARLGSGDELISATMTLDQLAFL